MENNFNNDFAKLCYPQVFYIKIYKKIKDSFALQEDQFYEDWENYKWNLLEE